jgi:uncharacterized protein (UPF0548 family)
MSSTNHAVRASPAARCRTSESGEEAFTLERHDDATITFTSTAFSRPSSLPAELSSVLGTWIQDRITQRYLRAIAD